ncbi:MAG: hypothetical protein HQM10_23495 [Candidatus Riflebacteria bacterium]|nr:hypothetical protein [Candidatus Riflebacteria bacterium]
MKNKFFSVFLCALFIWYGLSSILFAQEQLSPARKIAEVVKQNISGVSATELKQLMKKHFRQLRLLDGRDRWVSSSLSKISEDLIPSDLSEKDVLKIIDLMAYYAELNPYLKNFLDQADKQSFPVLWAKVQAEGRVVFPDVVALALALQNLTKAMHDDWRLMEICRDIWHEARKEANIGKYMSPFDYAKLPSVEGGINSWLDMHKSGKVAPDAGWCAISLNVAEAMAVDTQMNFKDNAKAGLVLAKYRPGAKKLDPVTGEGPSTWSKDRKAIAHNFAHARQWADLYATWNLAFVSHYDEFPYVMVKLLIPAVNHYQDDPPEYIYNRALALFTFLHHLYLGRADDAKTGRKSIVWRDDKLTRLWGAVNKVSSIHYDNGIQNAKKGK